MKKIFNYWTVLFSKDEDKHLLGMETLLTKETIDFSDVTLLSKSEAEIAVGEFSKSEEFKDSGIKIEAIPFRVSFEIGNTESEDDIDEYELDDKTEEVIENAEEVS